MSKISLLAENVDGRLATLTASISVRTAAEQQCATDHAAFLDAKKALEDALTDPDAGDTATPAPVVAAPPAPAALPADSTFVPPHAAPAP